MLPFACCQYNYSLRSCIDYWALNSHETAVSSSPDPGGRGTLWGTRLLQAGPAERLQPCLYPGGRRVEDAFITPNGHYEYIIMPFGLSIFQGFMNEVFRELTSETRSFLPLSLPIHSWLLAVIRISNIFVTSNGSISARPVGQCFFTRFHFITYRPGNLNCKADALFPPARTIQAWDNSPSSPHHEPYLVEHRPGHPSRHSDWTCLTGRPRRENVCSHLTIVVPSWLSPPSTGLLNIQAANGPCRSSKAVTGGSVCPVMSSGTSVVAQSMSSPRLLITSP